MRQDCLRAGALALVGLVWGISAAMGQMTDIGIAGPEGPLRGTYLAPEGAKAAAVIVPGSGPTDRDGNNPLGVSAAPYRLLAEALAERGIASVRIDKRGMFGSAGAIPDANAVTIADYAADVRAWAGELRARSGLQCVFLLGHSEGALVASVAAGQSEGVCGLVLVSGMGRNMADVLSAQIEAAVPQPAIRDEVLGVLDELRAERRVNAADMPLAAQPLFPPQVQGFVMDVMTYDLPALLRAYAGPVLVVHGDADIQVTAEDAERLSSARPGIGLKRLSGVNHVLKEASADDRAENIATYADPDLPLAPGVADAIAGFMLERR